MLVPLGLPIRGFARQIPIEALYNPVLGVYSSICRCGYPKVYPSVALEGKSLLKPHMTQYLESTWAYVASYVDVGTPESTHPWLCKANPY